MPFKSLTATTRPTIQQKERITPNHNRTISQKTEDVKTVTKRKHGVRMV
jgi:hypothetical protein